MKPSDTGTMLIGIMTILSSASLARAQSPQMNTSLLLRQSVTAVSDFTGGRSSSERLIFNDGLVIAREVDAAGRCHLIRSTASRTTVRNLQRALTANRVATQEGDCTIKEPVDNFLVEKQVTWFGRGRRQHTYRTGNRMGGLCPESTSEIEGAMQAVVADAFNSPAAQIATTCF
jgi:hypothetical protein